MIVYKDILPKEHAKEMIDELFNSERITLTDWEEQFLEDIYNAPVAYLSIKQTAVLWKIYNKKLG